MFKRLFLFFSLIISFSSPLYALKTACLNSSIADLWALAGGTVDITVGEAVERGFADEDAILVDSSSGRNINIEILISAQPDLVLGSVDTVSHVRLKALLDDIGIDMILIKEDCYEDFLSIFRTLTELTGRDDLYQEHGEGQKKGIEEMIKASRSSDAIPRVLFIRAGSAFSYVKAKRADDHFAAGIIEDLGAVNVADEFDALTDSLSLEVILKADPDKIIIVSQGDEEASRAYMEHMFSSPGWRDVDAIKEGRVVFLPKDLFHFKPNGRWLDAYRMMEEVIYG